MSKKRVITELAVQDLNAPRLKGSKRPRATLESDPNIPAEHAQIFQLLSQKKTWREIANYFPGYNTDSIKRRYKQCQNVLMKTFTPEDDEKLKNFLNKYEQEKYVVAGKALGKNVRDVQRRAKELKLV